MFSDLPADHILAQHVHEPVQEPNNSIKQQFAVGAQIVSKIYLPDSANYLFTIFNRLTLIYDQCCIQQLYIYLHKMQGQFRSFTPTSTMAEAPLYEYVPVVPEILGPNPPDKLEGTQ